MTRVAIPGEHADVRALDAVIELVDVSKSFGHTGALDGVTLSILPGRTTVLIGPSGCGKSTLLRLLVGLITPDGGEVRFEGTPIHRERLPELRLRMGYVIQEGGLFPHLTAGANAGIVASYLGWNAERIGRRLGELCELTRLSPEALARYPVELSGGQRQRVSLMRALMLDPDVLLMDEPLGALDPMIRSELQQDLREIFRTLGKTVVMVTHDMGEAAFFGGTIVLMRDGRIVQQGMLKDLLDRPSEPFVTQFFQAQRQVYGGQPCAE